MNIVTFTINNCIKCPFHYTDKIYTPDPFEHDEGCYCTQAGSKLVAADDWNLEKYTNIPDWCPLLNKKNIL